MGTVSNVGTGFQAPVCVCRTRVVVHGVKDPSFE